MARLRDLKTKGAKYSVPVPKSVSGAAFAVCLFVLKAMSSLLHVIK